MAHLVKKAFQLTPNQLMYQQKRYRGKINLKKPKVFYNRKVLNTLLTPFFEDPNKDKTLADLCFKHVFVEKKDELNPYEKIISKDVRNWFVNSKMVACLHVNSICANDLFDVRVPLKMANMYYKWYSPKIIRAAIKDSSYESLDPLIHTHTGYVFSPDINVITLQKIIKKSYKLYVLGGVIDGYVLKYDDFLKYGSMDILATQFGLVQILQNASGVNINRQLTHHQTTLVNRLKQIGTDETTSKKDEEQSVPV
ncbi:large ribosomal subunit protein uL10m-like isoform X1 [Ptiloglossa arizonensis]|uniref:large ribosomal subunit protein uL10m-like isoform X1 n=2 Tax=Ptiloglossa arizonensis TaxID=3350558 RepID=UPI003FA0D306